MDWYEYFWLNMESILYIGIAQSIFASILILMKNPKQLSDKLIAVLIGTFGIQLLTQLVFYYKLSDLISSSLVFKVLPFTYGPLIYLYVKKLTTGEQKIFKSEYRHFYLILTIPIFRILILVFPELKDLFSSYTVYFLDLKMMFVYGIFIIIHLSVYLILVYKQVNNFEHNLLNNISFRLNKLNLRWVKGLNILFFIGITVAILLMVFARVKSPSTPGYGKFLPAFLFTAFSYAYSLFAFRQQSIIEKNLIMENKTEEKKPKYDRSGLKEDDADNYVKKLLDYMRDSKAYLRNDLTISDVSDELKISRHYLTEVLNTKLKMNFYTFVNEYRIKEFIEELIHPDNKSLTLTGLAFKCGFNSKSSFQKMFKKFTGMTPTEYKKNKLG